MAEFRPPIAGGPERPAEPDQRVGWCAHLRSRHCWLVTCDGCAPDVCQPDCSP